MNVFDQQADARAVMAVNQRFYDAIEHRDFDAMAELWEHTTRASCVHPGWTILRGWEAVANSWLTLLDGHRRNHLILTNASITIEGDLAWVVLDEDLVDGDQTITFASTNIFARHDEDWLMVLHHGSHVNADS